MEEMRKIIVEISLVDKEKGKYSKNIEDDPSNPIMQVLNAKSVI
jgi:hypothetical protein